MPELKTQKSLTLIDGIAEMALKRCTRTELAGKEKRVGAGSGALAVTVRLLGPTAAMAPPSPERGHAHMSTTAAVSLSQAMIMCTRRRKKRQTSHPQPPPVAA